MAQHHARPFIRHLLTLAPSCFSWSKRRVVQVYTVSSFRRLPKFHPHLEANQP